MHVVLLSVVHGAAENTDLVFVNRTSVCLRHAYVCMFKLTCLREIVALELAPLVHARSYMVLPR